MQAVMVNRRRSKRIRPITLVTSPFKTFRTPARRQKFLADQEKVVPWQDLDAMMAPILLRRV